MSYPLFRLEAAPVGVSRCHVVLSTMDGARLACGSIELEWLTNVPNLGWQSSVVLGPVQQCDHAGTHTEPRSVFTGDPATP